MSTNLKQLKDSILADGIIDAEEVKKIKEVIYEDGKIDKEEAEFLFELNDAVSGKDNDPSWKDLMVEAITMYLLDDEQSPNVVDDEEARWLLSKIEKDGVLDNVEIAILESINSKAINISTVLTEKIKSLI